MESEKAVRTFSGSHSLRVFTTLLVLPPLLIYCCSYIDLHQSPTENRQSMSKTIADLGLDVLTTILDFSGAVAMLRLVTVGNTRLNSKISRSARTFELIYPSGPSFTWPKCFHYFPSLEHVTVRSKDIHSYTMVFGVDLMALPSTLRKLELGFVYSLLCLVELPPPIPTAAPHVARLRPELPAKFKNLKELNWNPNLPEEMRNWDFWLFVEDLCKWPLDMNPWPKHFKKLTLQQAEVLPHPIALAIDLRGSGEEAVAKLPSSLTHLEISGGSTYSGDLFGMLPPHLERLTIDSPLNSALPDFTPLSLLKNLTVLEFSVSTCDTNQMLLLPQSLRSLTMHIQNAEVESFAFFPSGLTALLITYDTIRSATTGSSTTANPNPWLSLIGPPTLSDASSSLMSSDIASKLPRTLKEISDMAMMLVRPKDWSLLPRGISTISRNKRPTSLGLDPESAPYAANLPRSLKSIHIIGICTTTLASSMPISLVMLTLPLTARNLSVSLPQGSPEERDAIFALNEAILDAISLCCPLLRNLVLRADETFDLEQLHHLTIPIQGLSVYVQPRQDEEEFDAIVTSKRESVEAMKVAPACFNQLEFFSLDYSAFALHETSIPTIFASCKALSVADFCSDEGDLIEDPSYKFPCKFLPLLPSSVTFLAAHLDRIDVNTFKSVPHTLRSFLAASTPNCSHWQWEDLAFLPRELRTVELPLPAGHANPSELDEYEFEESKKPIIESLRVFFDDVTFKIGLNDRLQPLYSNSRTPAPFLAMIAAERFSRSASQCFQPDCLDLQMEDLILPPPNERLKRKRPEE